MYIYQVFLLYVVIYKLIFLKVFFFDSTYPDKEYKAV